MARENFNDEYYYRALDYVASAYAKLKRSYVDYGLTEAALHSDDAVAKAIVDNAEKLGVKGISLDNVKHALAFVYSFSKESATGAEALDKFITDRKLYEKVKESEKEFKAESARKDAEILNDARSYVDVKKVVDAYVILRSDMKAYGLSEKSSASDFKAAMISGGLVNMTISQLNDTCAKAKILAQSDGKSGSELDSLEYLSRNQNVISQQFARYDGKQQANLKKLSGSSAYAKQALNESRKARGAARWKVFGGGFAKLLMLALIPGAIAGLFFGAAAIAGGFGALTAVANIGIVAATAFTGFIGYHILKNPFRWGWGKLTEAQIDGKARLSANENVVGSNKHFAKCKQLAKTAEKEYIQARVNSTGFNSEDALIIDQFRSELKGKTHNLDIEEGFSAENVEAIGKELAEKEKLVETQKEEQQAEPELTEAEKEFNAAKAAADAQEEAKRQAEMQEIVEQEQEKVVYDERVAPFDVDMKKRMRPTHKGVQFDESQELKVSEESFEKAYGKYQEEKSTVGSEKQNMGRIYGSSLEKTQYGGSEELQASGKMINKSIASFVNAHSKEFKDKGVNTGELIKSIEDYYSADSVDKAMEQREVLQKELDKVGLSVNGVTSAIGNKLNERYQAAAYELAERQYGAEQLKEMKGLEKEIDKKGTSKLDSRGMIVDFADTVRGSVKQEVQQLKEKLMEYESDEKKVEQFLKVVKGDKEIVDKVEKYLKEMPKSKEEEVETIEKIVSGESQNENEKLVVEVLHSAVMPMYKERLDREIAEQQEQARKDKELKEEAKRKKKEEKRKEKAAKVIKRGLEKGIQEDIDIEQGKQQEK